MPKRTYYVYIMANRRLTTFYVGLTNYLERRVFEHKTGAYESFTKRYNLDQLVYFEETDDISTAIVREKQLKNWHRPWKIRLIKQQNPKFKDLAEGWYDSIIGLLP